MSDATDLDPIDALVQELDSAAPSAGFADRVLAARVHRRRTARIGAIAAAAVGAASLAGVFALFVAGSGVDRGHIVAASRQSVAMGDHVVAVIEPAADVDYTASSDGVGVDQRSGSVFYRVERGTPTTVHTDAGDVVVHGTCFSVDVTSPKEQPMLASATAFPKTLAAAATGAAIGALLTVVVFEGQVSVQNGKGEVAVQPGHVATASADAAPTVREVPTRLDVHRLQNDNEHLRLALDGARAASGGDVQKLIDENAELRTKLQHADEELALADADRKDKEGDELPFPKDLPPRFTEKELLASFTSALKQAGIEGDVTHIDCDEYPCIVYGDVKTSDEMNAGKVASKLKNAPAFAPYQDDENNNSWWRSLKRDDKTGETEDESHFGIALWPKADSDKSDDIAKRIGFRNQQMWDAMKPAKH